MAKLPRTDLRDGAVGFSPPWHRVLVNRAEIGAARSKRSNEGDDYVAVKLDDPSFTHRSTPIRSTMRAATP